MGAGAKALAINWIETIQNCFLRGAVYVTQHAGREMEKEEFGVILTSELIESVDNLELLAEYPDDSPYPSALVFGRKHRLRPLHFVAAYSEEEELLTIVTVYQPDPKRWVEYKKRKQ